MYNKDLQYRLLKIIGEEVIVKIPAMGSRRLVRKGMVVGVTEEGFEMELTYPSDMKWNRIHIPYSSISLNNVLIVLPTIEEREDSESIGIRDMNIDLKQLVWGLNTYLDTDVTIVRSDGRLVHGVLVALYPSLKIKSGIKIIEIKHELLENGLLGIQCYDQKLGFPKEKGMILSRELAEDNI